MSAVRRRPVAEQLPAFGAEHVAATEARKNEYVPTPPWVERALFEGMGEAGHPPLPLDGPRIESAAGHGAIVCAVNVLAGPRPWTLVEVREDAIAGLRKMRGDQPGYAIRQGDYLTIGSGVRGPGLWITNPAYSIAADYLTKNLEEAAGIGTVALHVPWAFAATDALDGLEVDLYPIEGRPYSFVRETCWIVHGPGRGGRRLRLRGPR